MRPPGDTALSREAARLLSAVQLLTRLPVPDPGWEDGRMLRASRYFGLVGLAVGAAMAAVWLLAAQGMPPAVAAGLALVTGLLLTGALHEDGLADCADALGGQVDRARALEIMRDSRLGTYGVLALLGAMGLRWAALAALSPELGALALVLAASLGRGLMTTATLVLRPARRDGLGAMLGTGPRPQEAGLALAPALVLSALAGWAGFAALLCATAVVAWMLWRLSVRLGGYTGDGIGAVAALAETAALVALAAVWAGSGGA
jgi:adenosylcobinamide-GDP ribazoletransferase